MKTKLLILFLFVIIQHSFSQSEKMNIIFHEKNYIFPYALTAPVKTQTLPSKLNEISGISYMDDQRFAVVQDEKGIIYFLNFETAEIEKKIKFADDGDFEGITRVGKTAWALKSSGDLYRVKNFQESEDIFRAKKFETALSSKNDLEGITYDKAGNRLLLACKGHPYIKDKKGKHKKAIYEFDLKTQELNPKPIIIIDLTQVKEFRKYNTMTQWGIDLLSEFDENKGDVTFQPSGIAVHPVTGNFYILGAVGDLLMVLNREGQTLAMVDLDDQLFNQPEGICFDEKGNLYISNEGGEGKATLLEFSQH